ncbi:MAG: ATP-depentend DNA helicase [Beggiatoa sp. IS2]|nr:MAG: ATP-depentend DNA helicase [Beggiatoa sp. IS2]
MTLDLSSLNENQLAAVNWQDNVLLVLAGPGSGKTRVLTYRIARIIAETADQHFAILALTFTNKAAAEMRERLTKLIPNVTERVEVTTFHSFAASLLRQHGSHIGLRPDFTILNQEEDQKAILQEVLSKRDMENYSSEKLLPLINKLLQYGVLVENAKSILLKNKLGEEQAELLTQVYSSYCSQSIQNNCLDFGNLIIQATTLLQNKPFIQKFLHRIYYHVCVDEFQDTNRAQYHLLRQLVNPERQNLFIVADDDQIMYQWNGASPERLKNLQDDYQTTLIQLPENYRCPSEVIDLANRLISHNPRRHSDKLKIQAHRQVSASDPIRIQEKFVTFEEEAKWIANDIAHRSDKAGCVVLARSKSLLEIIVTELEKLSIPAYLHKRKDEFESTPLVWLHAMLRLANTRHDKKQLYRVCKAFYQLEGIKIEPETVESLAITQNNNDDYLRTWHILVTERNELSEQAKQILTESVSKLMDRLDFDSFIKKTFNWFDTLKSGDIQLQQETFIDYEEEKKTWQELQTEIEGQYGREQVTLYLLLQEIDLRSKKPSPPKNAIPCFTVHASKGMEFKHVYLAGMVEEHFPSWQAIKKGDNSSEMEEERRNCFVAITRTQETLTLTYSEKIFEWNKQPSRFLKEMGFS